MQGSWTSILVLPLPTTLILGLLKCKAREVTVGIRGLCKRDKPVRVRMVIIFLLVGSEAGLCLPKSFSIASA